MPEQEQVENYKITPEMRGFLKTYKAFNKIGTRLRGKLEIQLGEANQTRQMLQQIEKGMQMLTLNAPQKPTIEMEGQEPEEAEEPNAIEQMEQGRQSMNPMMNY